jgi:AcrR family transcriptional regulator
MIVAAAIAVIDSEGIAELSMRAVGRILGVDPKSLYHHIDGKEELLDAVAEHLLEQMRAIEPTRSPERDLRSIAAEFRRVALAHPQAAPLVLTRQLASVAGLAPIEAVLDVLRRAGVPDRESVHLLRTLVAGLIGTLLREVSASPTFGASDLAGIAARESALNAARLPNIARARRQLARYDSDQEFDYAVKLMVDMVSARAKDRT